MLLIFLAPLLFPLEVLLLWWAALQGKENQMDLLFKIHGVNFQGLSHHNLMVPGMLQEH